MQCSVEPGCGSGQDQVRERLHDRLLPPVRCLGPRQAPARWRQQENIDGDLYDSLVDLVVQTTSLQALRQQTIALIQNRAISWTRWRRTLLFFVDTLAPDDAEALQIDIAAIQDTMSTLSSPATWPFLAEPINGTPAARDFMDLEHQCRALTIFLRSHAPCLVPRPFGRNRVLLHSFSGRCRRSDVQFYLDAMMEKQKGLVLHVISIDIIIDPVSWRRHQAGHV